MYSPRLYKYQDSSLLYYTDTPPDVNLNCTHLSTLCAGLHTKNES